MEASECIDRLSELPYSLIFHIFSRMAMTDVVRTTILSKRWRNLWTTVTTLNFCGFKSETNTHLYLNKVRSFINRSFIFWRGERIQKLVIDFNMIFNQTMHRDIDVWLHFAKKYQVETLRLYLSSDDDHVQAARELDSVPRCLYSCSSLKCLDLEGCKLHIPTTNVSWTRLEYLRLARCWLSSDLVTKVLSSSPKLRHLLLGFLENNESLHIESSSLKYLYVGKYICYATANLEAVRRKKLRISTPNLEFLQISGVSYSECVLDAAVPHLYSANLLLYGPNGAAAKTLKHVLPNITHVRTISLTDWCIKGIGDMIDRGMVSPFRNVETLRLLGRLEKYERVLHLLKVFPGMQTLVLVQEKGQCWGERVTANLRYLKELRRVVVVWDEYYGEEAMFPFIVILWKYASKLEEMAFVIRGAAPSNSFLLALQRVSRSSPTARLIFCTEPGEYYDVLPN